MDAHEIVIHRMERHGAGVVLDLLQVQMSPARDLLAESCRNPSFRFSVRRHRLGYERPPSVSNDANIGQDLSSFFFGHFALRVR
jgi:hypothetical protein